MGAAMQKPLLLQAYRPSWQTDIRRSFELERQRLAALAQAAEDRLNQDFGTALGEALIRLAAMPGAAQ